MQKRRGGFTLIELLIVIVIIGILAAIAIPKFGKTREKAYFKAMQSDLRNLAVQQEIYYSNPASNFMYANAIGDLDVNPSNGVTLVVTGNSTGWVASATHGALTAPNNICHLYSGTGVTAAAAPTGVTAQPGIVYCFE
jgi:type IV pilus assembly protein PilA